MSHLQKTYKEILELDSQRYVAMLAGDLRFLDAVLDEGLVYIHSTGTVDTKAIYLDSLSTGAVRYVLAERLSAYSVEVDSVVLLHGEATLGVVRPDAAKKLSIAYLSAWKHTSDGWKMAAWSTTLLKAEPLNLQTKIIEEFE